MLGVSCNVLLESVTSLSLSCIIPCYCSCLILPGLSDLPSHSVFCSSHPDSSYHLLMQLLHSRQFHQGFMLSAPPCCKTLGSFFRCLALLCFGFSFALLTNRQFICSTSNSDLNRLLDPSLSHDRQLPFKEVISSYKDRGIWGYSFTPSYPCAFNQFLLPWQ